MQRPSTSASLRPEEQVTAPRAGAAGVSRRELWLAVVLPQLALDAIGSDERAGNGAAAHHADAPAAVYELAGGQLRIVAVNALARRAGIAAGFTVSAAMALCGTLALNERSPVAEDAYLDGIADRVGHLTPKISLEPREGLLLEVRASLRLFGGFEAIRRMLGDVVGACAAEFRIGAAPTALAALWSARHGSMQLPAWHELAGHLSRLPLTVTGWPAAVRQRLREMGIRTLGECMRLPRGGFARRVGRVCLDDLDKALGRHPDPRPLYSKPGIIVWSIDFAQETVDRRLIAQAIETGIGSIAADLFRRQTQTNRLRIEFMYPPRAASDVAELEFVAPLNAAPDLLAPVLTRLESIRLAGPVASIRLETGLLLPLDPAAGDLFEDPEGAVPVSSHAVLVECLRGRFGRDGVCGLQLRAEHRPELAFRRLTGTLATGQNGKTVTAPAAGARPLWLLPDPVRLADDMLGSMVCADRRPERIESGWWDGDDVQRDYYTVTTRDGECWWVYRDRATREWCLHGVFG